MSGYPDCFVYLKSYDHKKDEWFVYDKQDKILRIHRTKSNTDEEQIPLIFVDDDESKVIFNDCQAAIFFIGEPEQAMHAGTMAHLLMCAGLEMDIGIGPFLRKPTIAEHVKLLEPINQNNMAPQEWQSLLINEGIDILHNIITLIRMF
ncbi:unnamed protein product [Rotaria sordida]|nr:unnamed protein product [Rotaria sordida]